MTNLKKKILEKQKMAKEKELESPYKKPTGQKFNTWTVDKAKGKFKSNKLIFNILNELSRKHLRDNAAKLSTFLACCTAYLEPAKLRKSIAAKGSRSVGKDNMLKTCLSHLPKKDWLFLTNATQATMEDDIENIRIIAYSEVNLKKDDKGANAHLVETIKQLTEGGTSSMKKDVLSGYKTTKHVKQEQKTVLYGTTESDDDDELSTRFIVVALDAEEAKVLAVNRNTLDWFAGKRVLKKESWIAAGIKHLLDKNNVIMPYCKKLPAEIFGSSDSRSMRDVKRVLAMASAVTWLYQLQREIDEQGRIISKPFDLLAAIIISGTFFNYTYQGLGDQRLQKCMNAINEYCEEEGRNKFDRKEIQDRLGVTTNTIKGYLGGIKNLGIVGWSHNEGNRVYYERYQKGINRLLIGVNYKELIDIFKGIKGIKILESTVLLLNKLDSFINKRKKNYENNDTDSTSEKIDTLDLIPSPNKNKEKRKEKKKLTKSTFFDVYKQSPKEKEGRKKGMVCIVELIDRLQKKGYIERDIEALIKELKSEAELMEYISGFLKVENEHIQM